MLKLSSILLSSEKAEALTDFYQKVFAKDPEFNQGGYAGFQLGEGMFVIGPHDQVHGENKNPERILFNFETEDVEGDFKRVKELGAKVVKEPYDPSGGDGSEMSIATFADPDGNYFQLASPMKPPSEAN
ncbi:MAG TPA: VOC family protein [Candidatus Saccharimonadales bacterium]|nr:VOC family protein [Candidatus Saccharimonadales bacterium]